VVERAIILSKDHPIIRSEHLAFGSSKTNAKPELNLSFDHYPTLHELEQVYFETVLEKYSGHRSSVASTLDISERNVYRLIQKYGLIARKS